MAVIQSTLVKGIITGTHIRQQLLADLIGKDSHRGITLTYAWLANQFGHFSLGFIPAFLLFQWLQYKMPGHRAAFWAAIIICLVWLLFEAFNFLWPLWKQGQRNKSSAVHPFPPAWRNIAFDTATDLLFFWTGALSVSLLLHYNKWLLMALVIVVVVLAVYPVRYWFVTKMYLQTAGYPFQFRLNQWNFKLDDQQKTAVLEFVGHKGTGRHLLIYGPKGSGKTSLGVAIATERSIRHCACSYTTGVKLYSRFFEPVERPDRGLPLWDWRSCTTLVIDDINPGEPIKKDIVSPADFMQFLNTYTSNPDNCKTLASANVIWIMGTEMSPAAIDATWHKMLLDLGIPSNQIVSIPLSSPEA